VAVVVVAVPVVVVAPPVAPVVVVKAVVDSVAEGRSSHSEAGVNKLLSKKPVAISATGFFLMR